MPTLSEMPSDYCILEYSSEQFIARFPEGTAVDDDFKFIRRLSVPEVLEHLRAAHKKGDIK